MCGHSCLRGCPRTCRPASTAAPTANAGSRRCAGGGWQVAGVAPVQQAAGALQWQQLEAAEQEHGSRAQRRRCCRAAAGAGPLPRPVCAWPALPCGATWHTVLAPGTDCPAPAVPLYGAGPAGGLRPRVSRARAQQRLLCPTALRAAVPVLRMAVALQTAQQELPTAAGLPAQRRGGGLLAALAAAPPWRHAAGGSAAGRPAATGHPGGTAVG